MSDLVRGLRTGLRSAWISLVLAVLFLGLSVPAYRDMERLLIGLGVLSLLVALGLIGFNAAGARQREAD